MINVTNLTLADAASTPAPPSAPPPPSAPAAPSNSQTVQSSSPSTSGNTQSTTTPNTATKQPGSPAPVNPKGPVHNPGPFGDLGLPLILLLAVAVMWFFMTSSQRKQKKKRAEMLAQLSKGNKVQTVGGIIGTVADIRGDEVIVKVDENANTRLRFARNAIQSVVDDDKNEA